MVFDNFEQFTENYNGQGLYWQYFYHVWKTFSASPFSNAVIFTSQASSITGVTVSPASANVAQGTSIQMTGTVAGTGMYEKSVTWSISGQKEVDTSIDPLSGVLDIAPSEPTTTKITVTATAKDGKTGTATITVVSA